MHAASGHRSASGRGSWRSRLAAQARRLNAEIAALSIAARDPRTPWTAKVLVGVAVVYALSPVDLIPDFIPVLGYLDDLLLLPALIALAIRLIPRDVLEQARRAAREQRLARGARPWRYAIPVIAVWLVLVMLAGIIVWRLAS